MKEMTWLENREVYKPILLKDLIKKEISKAMNSLIFLTEKRDGSIGINLKIDIISQK